MSTTASGPKPIWVLGLNRSGTKWISNVILNHDDVVGVQHEHYFGLMESPLVDDLPRIVGDLSTDGAYEHFVREYALSDYSKVAQMGEDELLALDPRPATALAVQKTILDRLARRAGARMWLQKTSPFIADSCFEAFPDARFVFIHRDPIEQINAAARRNRDQIGASQLLRLCFIYVLGEKIRHSHFDRDDCIFVSFEEMQRDAAGAAKRVCAHVGIPYHDDLLEIRFPRNTAFATSEERARNLSNWKRGLIRIATTLFEWLPLRVLLASRARLESSGGTLPKHYQRLGLR